MQNFVFHNPTRIVFGRDKTASIGKVTLPYGKRVLLLTGQGSVVKHGILAKVTSGLSAAGISWVECSGVQPNPVLGFVRQAIDTFRRENLDAIVAVGGGSVIDTAKAVAAGVRYEGDVWDFFTGKANVLDAAPITVVLTLPAAASEMNSGGVITNEQTRQKFNLGGEPLSPKVSILDPVNSFSAPVNHSLYGVVDAMVHLLEGYFNGSDPWTPLQDRYAEGIIRTLMECAAIIREQPDHYDARANIMWGATLAFNGLAPCGIGPAGFPMHMIEHSLSALYDVSHGAGLAMILPGWLKYHSDSSPRKVNQFGRRIFELDHQDDRQGAQAAIAELERWLRSMDIPASLHEGGIPIDEIPAIAENAVMLAQKWGLKAYTQAVIEDVLRRASR